MPVCAVESLARAPGVSKAIGIIAKNELIAALIASAITTTSLTAQPPLP